MPWSNYWRVFRGMPLPYFNSDIIGVSGVGIWMIFFSVLVPIRPRNALIGLILAASSVPVTVAALIHIGDMPALPPMQFIFTFVTPYVICVFLAWFGARIVYGLGREVGRAEELGSYRLRSRIGVGGMGEVWRADHAMLARPAAVKLVRREVLGSDPQDVETALARFEREAQVTASLQSPHTVELYDFGVSEDGSLYYVMELLEGIDLEALVKRHGPLPPERVVHVLVQVCHSLGEAHRKGLVHRDIKPSNIVLCRRAFDSDFVKVLDFGLVKRVSDSEAGVDLTKAGLGQIAGTPSYIAPEIALGKKDVDGRADLYGLGCVAYWMLTGRRVFEEENAVAIILAHVNATPLAPSRVSEEALPADLDAVVLACLAKEPAARPADAEALSGLLRAVSLDRAWTADRADEWWRLTGGWPRDTEPLRDDTE